MKPTDDQAGPSIAKLSDMPWATFVAMQAYEACPDWGSPSAHVDEALRKEGFVTVDPFDLEDTCERTDVIAVIDVGEHHLIPIAIKAPRTDFGTRIWHWDHVSPQKRFP